MQPLLRRTCIGVALALAGSSALAQRAPEGVPRPVVAGPGLARLAGAVFDSLHGHPLTDALVQLIPIAQITQGFSVRTGPTGRFVFPRIPRGDYLLGFSHPILDSLALELPLVAVTIDSTPLDPVSLFVPSALGLRRRICHATPKDSGGLVIATVRSATDGAPLPDARVELRWRLLVGRYGRLQPAPMSSGGVTGPEGVLAICNVPVGLALDMLVARGADSTGVFQVTVPADGLLQRDVFVGPSVIRRLVPRERNAGAPHDSATSSRESAMESPPTFPTVRRGSGRVRGTVRGPLDAPIAGARVSVGGSGAAGVSGADGTFAIDSLPLGTWPLYVRAIGFLPQTVAVDILASRENTVALALASVNVALDTVKVFGAQPLAAIMAPFEKRRKQGWGRFLDEKQIEARHPLRLADLLRGMPGVHITPGPTGDVVLFDLGGHDYCAPSLMIDGSRTVGLDGVIEGIVSVNDLRGVEVYVRNPPAELMQLSGCGGIALWTGRQPSKGPEVKPD